MLTRSLSSLKHARKKGNGGGPPVRWFVIAATTYEYDPRVDQPRGTPVFRQSFCSPSGRSSHLVVPQCTDPQILQSRTLGTPVSSHTRATLSPESDVEDCVHPMNTYTHSTHSALNDCRVDCVADVIGEHQYQWFRCT